MKYLTSPEALFFAAAIAAVLLIKFVLYHVPDTEPLF